MKKFALLIGLFCLNSCFGEELFQFADIKLAALNGKKIHTVIDFPKCSILGDSTKSTAVIGAFTPDSMMIDTDHISASMTHFTFNGPSFPGKAVVEFVGYKITGQRNVQLSYQPLDAISYTPVASEQVFNCTIGYGARFFS